MASHSVRAILTNPTLAPLFVCLGAGVVGSLGFGAYYLGNNSDVVLKKKSLNQDGPWNLIPQHHNSKLFTWNEDAWKQRQGMPHPQAAFMDGDLTGKTSDAAKIAKAKAIRKAGATAETAAH